MAFSLSLSRWRPRHLLAAWGAYWLGLAAVTLGPAAMAIWRMSQGPDGHGSVSASYGEGAFHLNVTVEGATAFAGSARLLAIALWVAGPPLALWLLWLWRRPDRAVASPSVSTLQPTESAAALPAPGMEPIEVGRRERQAAERGRQR